MNKVTYKQMMMKNFIKASNTIMDTEGIESITIRKVANLVSVNSATIYNHFENLEHLKIFSCLSCFDKYINDLPNYIEYDKDMVYNYLKVWECFINHTIDNIEVFYILFFNSLEKDLDEYIKDYYEIFPISNENFDNSVLNMLKKSTLKKRNEILLLEIYKNGKIEKESIEWINNLSIYTYESILHRLYRNKIDKVEGKKQMMDYISKILEECIIFQG